MPLVLDRNGVMVNGHTGGIIMAAGVAGICSLLSQVVIDTGTLIPAGVAVVAMGVLVRVTWKLSQVHTDVLHKLERLEKKHLDLDEKHLRNFRRIVQLQQHMQEMVAKIMDHSDISYHGLDAKDLNAEEAKELDRANPKKPPKR